ncbi:lysophospholipid acyltransferase family protein [Endozoicomonas ascidiicola]|uniref:lysophospholipid acyltransferase family protein n=1 Tax=Endozoicomonas ascidiicola TaxID=1698521 RepID=UPI00082FBF64|nr:lysophospholipid acyltransferase family protein [Endozoicomonas ascidiicola]
MSAAASQNQYSLFSTCLAVVRTAIFYSCLAVWTIFWSVLMILLISFLPFRQRHQLFVKPWAIVAVYLCRFICGISWKVTGRENIPAEPCVVISNHQSAWEAFFLQTLLTPQTQVIKQEILNIPFYGWAFRKIKPIAIDRKDVRLALQQVREQGKAALEHRVWVLIFPEGTRTLPGEPRKFSRGGAGLAKAAETDILPIAHNSGSFWPSRGFLKRPGTIQVEVGNVIKTESLSVAEANDQARNTIAESLNRFYATK